MSAFPPPSAPDRRAPEWLAALIESARAEDGQPPFSDQALVDVRTGKRELLNIDEVAAALVSATEVELAVRPDARRRGNASALLQTVISRSRPGLLAWSHGDHPGARVLAERFGFEPVRRLLQLRLSGLSSERSERIETESREEAAVSILALERELDPLWVSILAPERELDPLAVSTLTPERELDPLVVRSFRVGADEDAWLALNARAFVDHPEQGAVTRGDLEELEREPWFDADDFLVLVDGDAMIGYCWLKIDPSTGSGRATMGELYVVGVDPERQGEGLGRRLVTAGLSRLGDHDIRTASLYVEADNAAALALYRSFGFAEYAADVQYRLR